MKRLIGCQLLVFTGLLSALLPAWSKSLEAERLLACRAIAAVAERLACYDAIAVPGAAGEPGRASPPVPAQAAVVPAAPEPAAGFGLPRPRPAEEAATAAIEARVVGAFSGWARGTRISLDNGQVWEVVDQQPGTYRLDAPRVRITRGLLGSFFMAVEGTQQTPRVRRVR